jgi:hypothetical protein
MKLASADEALRGPLNVQVTDMVLRAVDESARETGVSRDRIVNDALCRFFALPTSEGDEIPIAPDDYWEGNPE